MSNFLHHLYPTHIIAMANDPSPPARSGLSLYANLLDPKGATPGSISSAPVSYKQQDNAEQDEVAKQQQTLAGT